jgi:trehalose 6-phosphate phosphatase
VTGGPSPAAAVRPRVPWTEARRLALALLDAPGPLLVIADFDGTIAPITRDPLATRIDPLARVALRRLARVAEARPELVTPVILSGRTPGDVAGRVRVGGVRYLGDHGIAAGALPRRGRPERLAVRVPPELLDAVPEANAVGDAVARSLGSPAWLFVERKGPSVAFHFRKAPDPERAREQVLAAVAAAESAGGGTGLIRLEGRMVVELRPVGAGGKGAATERLLTELRPGAAIAFGDDRTDAEAFMALRASRARRGIAALAVGVDAGHEVPQAVLDASDVLVASPHDAARVLSAVARALERFAFPRGRAIETV